MPHLEDKKSGEKLGELIIIKYNGLVISEMLELEKYSARLCILPPKDK